MENSVVYEADEKSMVQSHKADSSFEKPNSHIVLYYSHHCCIHHE